MYELYKFSYHETEYNDDTEKKTLVIESNFEGKLSQRKWNNIRMKYYLHLPQLVAAQSLRGHNGLRNGLGPTHPCLRCWW